MSMEQPQWNAPQPEEEQSAQLASQEHLIPEREEEAIADPDQERREEMERWAENRDRLRMRLFDRIDGEAVCQRVAAELTEEGLFDLDEGEYPKVYDSNTIQNMREDKELEKALYEMAEQLPEGEEKSAAVNYAQDYWVSFEVKETKMSSDAARQDARHSADYGALTVKNETRLLENFRRFKLFNAERFERRMKQLSIELQEQINEQEHKEKLG